MLSRQTYQRPHNRGRLISVKGVEKEVRGCSADVGRGARRKLIFFVRIRINIYVSMRKFSEKTRLLEALRVTQTKKKRKQKSEKRKK